MVEELTFALSEEVRVTSSEEWLVNVKMITGIE
jgi:hypothetical protein